MEIQEGSVDGRAYQQVSSILESALWRRQVRRAEQLLIEKESPPPGVSHGGGQSGTSGSR